MKRRDERLTAWVLIGGLALNYPLLSLFSKPSLWFGIPALYVYLFAFWGLFIAVVALMTGVQEPPAETRAIPPGSQERD